MPVASPTASRWTTGRILAVAVSIAMVAMWAYVVYLAVGPGRQPPRDRLEDPTFAPAAEARCSDALDEVAALPPASETPSATERADVIAEANGIFAAMLDDLAELTPAGEDGEIVSAWLADWRVYLADRTEFAAALRDDPEARLLVSAKDREQVTEFIDGFAADNHMPACATPIDV